MYEVRITILVPEVLFQKTPETSAEEVFELANSLPEGYALVLHESNNTIHAVVQTRIPSSDLAETLVNIATFIKQHHVLDVKITDPESPYSFIKFEHAPQPSTSTH